MEAMEAVRSGLPDCAKDLRLNLQSVMEGELLTPAQKWGVAVASAAASRNPQLYAAVVAAAKEQVDDAVIDDAKAAAALMGMNNVYYRFRHMVGKPSYATKRAALRMQRIARPLGDKTDFELYSLAVSAIHGCEACVQSHEKVVVDGGVTEDQVHDAVRVAAVIHGAALAGLL